MFNDVHNRLFDAPHRVVFPALAVLLSVLALIYYVTPGATGSIPEPALK
jgi:hypothetical protein